MNVTNPIDPVQLYQRAVEALNRSHWPQALELSLRVQAANPSHAGVCFVAGVASLQLHQMQQALGYLQRATKLNPVRPDYAAQFARALATAQLLREAVTEAERALSLQPGDAMTLDTLGVVFTQGNAHAQAIDAFRRAAASMPQVASYRFNVATSLAFSGDIGGARDDYEACLRLEPRYWKAHLALAQLRKQTAETQHLDRLRALLEQNAHDAAARLYVNLSIAKELEDLGDFPAAFRHLTAGKSAGGEGRQYSSARDAALFEALALATPRGLPQAQGSASREPIFVIGMPRSGTTLVDRILSSHPAVHSAGELQNFGVLFKRASGSRTRHLIDPDTIARARSIDWSRLGEAYVQSTRPGTGHTAHFVDKLPHNFLYVGFIAQALPNARIVCLRRGAMDTCLSNFRQLFAQTSPYYDYSFDLLDTGRYYVMFDRLMAHWRQVLPGRILEIDYEGLVDEQEATTRRLLEFCGLEWDGACLRFEENAAPVATASMVQVRSPMNRQSLGRWKHYGADLDDLQALLAEAGIPSG